MATVGGVAKTRCLIRRQGISNIHRLLEHYCVSFTDSKREGGCDTVQKPDAHRIATWIMCSAVQSSIQVFLSYCQD